MDTKRATLKFWTLEALTEESATPVVVIPFTLHVEGEYPRSFHVRAVRSMTEGPVEIEFPPGQAFPVSNDTIRIVAHDYYLAALVAAESKTGRRRYVRFVREYPIDL
jgi:hypothetical protein